MENYSKMPLSDYVQVPICDKTVTAELSGDFTLPDYQPEIKRLLKISAGVLPPSKYIGDNNAEFAGNIDYYVLYTGSDNQIYCAPLTSEYKVDVPIDKNGDMTYVNMIGNADIVADMISGRVTSPRKLNIKCRLKSRAQIFGDMPLDNSFDGTSDGENQLLRGRAALMRTVFGAGEMLRLSDEMIIDSRDSETRVVSAQGNALMEEVDCTSGAIRCRGDLYLKLLMVREGDGEPYTSTRKIPFSQTIPMDMTGGKCQANAKATVCELSINVEDNRIVTDVGMIIEATAYKTENVNYIKDIYSTTHKTECEYKILNVGVESCAANTNFTLSDSMTLEDAGLSPEYSVIDTNGTIFTENTSFDGGKMSVSGKAKYNILLKKDTEYSTADIEFPFKYTTDACIKTADGAECIALAMPCVISSRARVDGERIGIDSEIGVCMGMWNTDGLKVLDSVSFGDEIDAARGEYVICYPSRTDTLWSVAKRYGATVSSLSRANQLSTDCAPDTTASLEKVNYLII